MVLSLVLASASQSAHALVVAASSSSSPSASSSWCAGPLSRGGRGSHCACRGVGMSVRTAGAGRASKKGGRIQTTEGLQGRASSKAFHPPHPHKGPLHGQVCVCLRMYIDMRLCSTWPASVCQTPSSMNAFPPSRPSFLSLHSNFPPSLPPKTYLSEDGSSKCSWRAARKGREVASLAWCPRTQTGGGGRPGHQHSSDALLRHALVVAVCGGGYGLFKRKLGQRARVREACISCQLSA
jgi:hypothetical protein